MITSAGARPTSPCAINEVTNNAASLLLYTSAVMSMSEMKASGFFNAIAQNKTQIARIPA
jgi:hypothetical protein